MTRDQLLKLRKHWQWVEGQLARGYLTVNGNDAGRFDYRVNSVVANVPYAIRDGEEYAINLADPVLVDKATSDGLLRTARSAHDDPGLHVMPLDANHSSLGWRAWSSSEDCWKGDTGQEALIAAIEAAPEPTSE